MYVSYSSSTHLLKVKCSKCSKESTIGIDAVQVYTTSMNEGVFLRFPECVNCKSVCTVYTGTRPDKKGATKCHAHCVVAKAAFAVGKNLLVTDEDPQVEESSVMKEKLDAIESTYENGSSRHKQFLGDKAFSLPDLEAAK